MTTDPRFPNRPDTPDFWRLSAAVQAMDAEAEQSDNVFEVLGVDEESLTYLIEQRIGMAFGEGLSPRERTRLMVIALDMFALGMRYAKPNSSIPPRDTLYGDITQ